MRQYSNLKKLLRHLDNQGAAEKNFRETNWIRVAKVVLPILVCGALIGAIAAMDAWGFRHPELREMMVAGRRAYFKNLAEELRTNPWGTMEKDPKSYLQRVLVGMNPAMRARFNSTLDKLPKENAALFARIFQMLELRPDQLRRLTERMEKILASEGAEKRLAAMPKALIAAAKIIEKLVPAGAFLPEGRTAVQGQDLAFSTGAGEAGQAAATEAGKAITEEDALAMAVDLFTGQEEGKSGRTRGLFSRFSPALAARLAEFMASFSAEEMERLLAILDGLGEREAAMLLNCLARLSDEAVGILITRLGGAGVKDLVSACGILIQLPANTSSRLLSVTGSFSTQNFFALMKMSGGFNQATINQFMALAEKAPSPVVEEAVGVVSAMGGQWQSKAVGILGEIKADSAAKLVDVARQVGTVATVEKGVKILDDLASTESREKAIGVMYNLNSRELMERSITIMEGIGAASAKLTVNLASELGAEDQKKAFKVLDRVQDRDGRNNFRRIGDMVQRFSEVGDAGVLSKALSAVDPLDDKALNQAVSVMVNLDQKRTAKAVNAITRIGVEERTSAVDTLDRIPVSHMKNAVDLAGESDDKMLKDAVAVTDRFKVRLKDDEALASTQRAINIASKVDPGTRRIGLSALMQESDINAKRALSQVDGREELFTPARISQMADVYSKVDRASQTKLTEIVAGSSGMVFMGVGAGGGAAQSITQQRKLDLIKGAMDNKEKAPDKFGRQLEVLKKRPVLVPQGAEETFQVKAPVPVMGVRGKETRRFEITPAE